MFEVELSVDPFLEPDPRSSGPKVEEETKHKNPFEKVDIRSQRSSQLTSKPELLNSVGDVFPSFDPESLSNPSLDLQPSPTQDHHGQVPGSRLKASVGWVRVEEETGGVSGVGREEEKT